MAKSVRTQPGVDCAAEMWYQLTQLLNMETGNVSGNIRIWLNPLRSEIHDGMTVNLFMYPTRKGVPCRFGSQIHVLYRQTKQVLLMNKTSIQLSELEGSTTQDHGIPKLESKTVDPHTPKDAVLVSVADNFGTPPEN